MPGIFDAVPDLKELVAKDQGIQDARQALGDTLKGALLGVTTDAIGGLVDPINPKSPLSSNSLREVLGQSPQENDSPDTKLSSLLSGLFSAAGLASLAKLGTSAKTLLPALIGAITPRGRRDISLVHNLTGDVLGFLKSERPLSNPSIAVANNPYPFDKSPTLVFNPNSKLLDPAIQKQNQLFNRDAYTSRNKNPILSGTDQRLGGETGQFPDLRFTEGSFTGADQRLAILSSPNFRSFKEFENSSAGVGTLRGFGTRAEDRTLADEATQYATDAILKQAKEAKKEFEAFRKQIGNKIWDTNFQTTPEHTKLIQLLENQNKLYTAVAAAENAPLEALRIAAHGGDRQAGHYLKELKKIGSDYGELKVIGNVPIDARNVNAILLPSQFPLSNEDALKLMQLGKEKGISAGYAPTIASKDLKERAGFFADKMLNDIVTQTKAGVPYQDLWITTPSGLKAASDMPSGVGRLMNSILNNSADLQKRGQEYTRRQVWEDPVILKQLLSELGAPK